MDYEDDNLECELPFDEEEFYAHGGWVFANEGSCLHAPSDDMPRDQPCGQCGNENRLTILDKQRHYVCDSCADRNEGIGW